MFVFKAHVGVVAPAILTAMDRAEPLTEPITLTGRSEANRNLSRNLTFLLAHVLTGPPLQLMMNVGEQNGLVAWSLLVLSEQPVTGANRIAATQAILQCKFSPGFTESVQRSGCKRIVHFLAKRSQTRSPRQSSSPRCLLRPELIWSCKPSREPQNLTQ